MMQSTHFIAKVFTQSQKAHVLEKGYQATLRLARWPRPGDAATALTSGLEQESGLDKCYSCHHCVLGYEPGFDSDTGNDKQHLGNPKTLLQGVTPTVRY